MPTQHQKCKNWANTVKLGGPPKELTIDYGAILVLKISFRGFEEIQLISGKGNYVNFGSALTYISLGQAQ